MIMLKKLISFFNPRKDWRELRGDERVMLDAIREKYPAHQNDKLFFVEEDDPLLPVTLLAMITVWGEDGDGPWIHISNLAGFMADGMTLDEIKKTQF